MITRNPFPEPIDLSGEVHPQPKQYKKKKEPKAINKIGKKGEEDKIAKAENKQYMEELGITTCEAKIKDVCWKNNALSFAHPDKRRFLTKEDLRKAIIACIPCHEVIEKWPRAKMKKFILGIIKNRKVKK